MLTLQQILGHLLVKAAKVADEYSLSHKGIFKYGSSGSFPKNDSGGKGSLKGSRIHKSPPKGSKKDIECFFSARKKDMSVRNVIVIRNFLRKTRRQCR